MPKCPNKSTLDWIESYPVISGGVVPLIIEIINGWWKAESSITMEHELPDTLYLYLNTLGHGGNESIINALKKNKHFFDIFLISKYGTGYKFQICEVDRSGYDKINRV